MAVGVPLTVDFLGGSMLTGEQYPLWKVVHGYGVFLSFINFFFGLCVDRLSLSRQQDVPWILTILFRSGSGR